GDSARARADRRGLPRRRGAAGPHGARRLHLMRAYRIVKKRHALAAFSGDGARAYGGRWNLPGTPMVYAAQTRALAALESLAHFGGAERRMAFVTFEIEIPENLALRLVTADLPRDWRSEEPGVAT